MESRRVKLSEIVPGDIVYVRSYSWTSTPACEFVNRVCLVVNHGNDHDIIVLELGTSKLFLRPLYKDGLTGVYPALKCEET